eukprot:400612_1
MATTGTSAPLIKDNPWADNKDGNIFDDSKYADDPLLRQLPQELQDFVVKAGQHGTLEYVDRSGIESTIHKSLSVLCCCYSLCKMVLIKQGEIGLTQNGDKPELLGPGRHVLLSPFNHYMGTQQVTAPVIRHGCIHIIRVKIGQLGYAVNMKTGRPILLARGKHIINDINFVWKKFITLRDRITQLDQLQIIRIETGYVGYAYKKGNLKILKPGLHLIEPPDRFGDIITTQMQIIDMPEAINETSDYVPLAIKAAIFFRIVNPEKALRRISNIKQQITETAVATLAGIIRSSSLSDIASRSNANSQPFYHEKQSKNLTAKETSQIINYERKEEKKEEKQSENTFLPTSVSDEPSAPPFFQHVHDEFIQQLHDHVLDEWGIEIQNIRIESLKINDPQLQKNISNNAIDVSKQHNKYIMLQKQQEIMIVEADTQAAKLKIETDTQTSIIRTIAQAEANAIIVKAKAEKESIELKGKGESEYSRLLESTKLGNKLSLMKIQAESIKGLKQVCYIPQMNGLLDTRQAFAQNKLIPNLGPNQNELLV